MGWLIALAVLVLLGILPLGVSTLYDSGGPVVNLIIGPVRWRIYPAKDKEKKKEKKEKKKARKNKKKSGGSGSGKAQPEEKKSGGPITDFLPLAGDILEFLVDFQKKVRVDRLELNLILAGSDPCDLATNYGKACAAIGNLWPRLEEFVTIKKRNVKVQCDFEAETTLVIARLDLTITVARLLSAGIRLTVRGLGKFLEIMNKRKGGAAA